MRTAKLRLKPAGERELLAHEIASRMDGPMTVLGIIFLLLVLAETLARPQGPLGLAFGIASWALWLAFVAEFAVRAVVAPSTSGFLRRNWWQVLFLILPFLRFARVFSRFRVGRLGRVISSGVRSGRSARAALSSRLGWLAALTVIVILAASQTLYELGQIRNYGRALYQAALATIVGEPIPNPSGVVALLNVALGLYSVIVFAALAGMLGAFFLEGPKSGSAAAGPLDRPATQQSEARPTGSRNGDQ